MTANRRIFLNIVSPCGRSLREVLCGVVVGRWVVAALGKSEGGLDGVVGGMTVIVMLAYTMRLLRGGIAAVGSENCCGNQV